MVANFLSGLAIRISIRTMEQWTPRRKASETPRSTSCGRSAAIDCKHRAVNEAGLVARQERDRRGDLLRAGRTSSGSGRSELVKGIDHAGSPFGPGRTRAHRVHPDTVWAELCRPGLGQ